MKKNACFVLIIFSLILLSCKKENPATPDNSNYKVKTYSEKVVSGSDSISATYNFTYDSQNRITSMFLASNPAEKFTFSYNSGSQIGMDLLSSTGNIHEDFFLKNALIDSTYQYDDTQDTSTEKYVYNGTNQLTKLYEYDYYNGQTSLSNTTNYTYDSNGNLVKSEDSYNEVDTYDYYPDLVTPMPAISPATFLVNKNLEKTHTVLSNGVQVETVTSTYTFDESNRISTIIATSSSGLVITKTFTYF